MSKKENWGLFCRVLGLIFVISAFFIEETIISVCLIVLGGGLGLFGLNLKRYVEESDRKQLEASRSAVNSWFEQKYREYGADKNNIIHINIKEYTMEFDFKHHYWIKDGNLYFFPQKDSFVYCRGSNIKTCEEKAKLISIPISNIEYFKCDGDISYTTRVSSSGVNIKGAAVGAAVAGQTGAIIGSRPQIKSTVEKNDDRTVELKYRDDNNVLKTLSFKHDALDIFRNLFPEKEYEYAKIVQKTPSEAENITVIEKNDPTIEERFEKLKRLKASGLITEDEFSAKKEELLKQI